MRKHKHKPTYTGAVNLITYTNISKNIEEEHKYIKTKICKKASHRYPDIKHLH